MKDCAEKKIARDKNGDALLCTNIISYKQIICWYASKIYPIIQLSTHLAITL